MSAAAAVLLQQQAAAAAAAAAAQASSEEDLPPSPELAVVRVRRRVASTGAMAPGWTVLVDGEVAGQLEMGERCQFYVYPGRHQLVVRPRWVARPGAVVFDAVAGETIEFTCRFAEGVRFRPPILIERPSAPRIVGNRPPPGAPPPPPPPGQ